MKNIFRSKNYKPLISWISWHSLHLHHTPLRGSGEFSFHFNFKNFKHFKCSKYSKYKNTNISEIFAPRSTERLWRIRLSSLFQIFQTFQILQIFQIFQLKEQKIFQKYLPHTPLRGSGEFSCHQKLQIMPTRQKLFLTFHYGFQILSRHLMDKLHFSFH